jgi:hypothetical protein
MHEIAHYAERQTSSELRNWLEWVKLSGTAARRRLTCTPVRGWQSRL